MMLRCGTLLLLLLSLESQSHAASPPNVVLIMADDLGVGDVGVFGNDSIRTPNIDRIAREGVRFDHSIASASVCTPSRASFITGRYPVRMGMVPVSQSRVFVFLSGTSGLPSEEITIGELAQKKGYATGFIGKWHLGMHCTNSQDFCHHPNKQGFDYYYGVPLTNLRDFGPDKETAFKSSRGTNRAHELAMSAMVGILMIVLCVKLKIMSRLWASVVVLVIASPVVTILLVVNNMATLNGIVMRNTEVVEQPIHLEGFAKRLSTEGVNFLEKRKEDNQPFLLVLSWLQHQFQHQFHISSILPLSKEASPMEYRLSSAVHTALHASPEFQGTSAFGPYGDNVEEMDASVGHILNALDKLGFANNTFVYFTSDNGGHVEDIGPRGNREGGYNGIYKGGKLQGGMDGGIRVPTVARFPGTIPPGTVMSLPVSLMDVFPTVASIIQAPMPKDRSIDGVDLLPYLLRQNTGVPHPFLVHYCGNEIHAARYTPDADSGDVWKVHFATPNWEEGTEGCGYLCHCWGSDVTYHDPPLLYNIGKDPSENTLLQPQHHKEIMDYINNAVGSHVKSVESVENQFSTMNMIPRPWLQPCCNFPYCKCAENKTVG